MRKRRALAEHVEVEATHAYSTRPLHRLELEVDDNDSQACNVQLKLENVRGRTWLIWVLASEVEGSTCWSVVSSVRNST